MNKQFIDSVSKTLLSLYESNKKSDQRIMLSVVVTGAGSTLSKWLFGQPGASSTLLSFEIPYSKQSSIDFIQNYQDIENDKFPRNFVSQKMSEALAISARNKGMNAVVKENGLNSCFDDKKCSIRVIGLSLTAVIATNRKMKGSHRCFISVVDSFGELVSHSFYFSKDLERTRRLEDEICSFLALKCFLNFISDNVNLKFKKLKTLKIKEKLNLLNTDNMDKLVNIEISKIIKNEKNFIFLKPQWKDSNYEQIYMSHLPFRFQKRNERNYEIIVLCGSFNPLHLGHEAMINFSADYVKKLRKSPYLQILKVCELSVKNPDKGMISLEAVQKRVKQFVNVVNEKHEGFNSKHGPYSCILSNEKFSRFVEKSEILKNCYVILGFDTAIRLIDKKYYNEDENEMLLNLIKIKQNGVLFLVFGRLNKETNEFEDFTKHKKSLAPYVQDMFFVITEKEFRFDMSSTELRNKM